jgi:hypothetical protein
VILHAMHSATDWLGYAVWQDGVLLRSLSLSPDGGITEDIGAPLPFEASFWAGEHPVASSRVIRVCDANRHRAVIIGVTTLRNHRESLWQPYASRFPPVKFRFDRWAAGVRRPDGSLEPP